MTELWVGQLGFNPQQRQGYFSLCHHNQIGSGAHPASYLMGTGGSFSRVKAARAWRWL